VHQWLKNLLLFVPVLAAHQIFAAQSWVSLAVAFLAFSLCASSVYIANDLLDLDSDRIHPRKRKRPFASGQVPVWMGVALAPVLLLISLGLAAAVGNGFMAWLVVYFVLTCAYSWGLKRLTLVDCLTLAILYTLRIVAGAAAAGLGLSFWILAFSVFLFLSLAFVKRYAELHSQAASGNEKVHGRGYYTSDAQLIQTFGITSGYASVVVLALYLNSDAVVQLYKSPQVIWGAVPLVLFWVSWMWLKAHRGQMHDDPLVFAVKDRTSIIAGVLFILSLVLGAGGWSWLSHTLLNL
jgi:4-hydroxybenzoate polyprenyltransferase